MLFRFAVILLTLTSCLYRLPEDDEVHVLPNTNNPDVIHETQSADSSSFMPGVAF